MTFCKATLLRRPPAGSDEIYETHLGEGAGLRLGHPLYPQEVLLTLHC